MEFQAALQSCRHSAEEGRGAHQQADAATARLQSVLSNTNNKMGLRAAQRDENNQPQKHGTAECQAESFYNAVMAVRQYQAHERSAYESLQKKMAAEVATQVDRENLPDSNTIWQSMPANLSSAFERQVSDPVLANIYIV